MRQVRRVELGFLPRMIAPKPTKPGFEGFVTTAVAYSRNLPRGAIEKGITAEDVAYTCHAHPTETQAVKEAAMAAGGLPIHM